MIRWPDLTFMERMLRQQTWSSSASSKLPVGYSLFHGMVLHRRIQTLMAPFGEMGNKEMWVSCFCWHNEGSFHHKKKHVYMICTSTSWKNKSHNLKFQCLQSSVTPASVAGSVEETLTSDRFQNTSGVCFGEEVVWHHHSELLGSVRDTNPNIKKDVESWVQVIATMIS